MKKLKDVLFVLVYACLFFFVIAAFFPITKAISIGPKNAVKWTHDKSFTTSEVVTINVFPDKVTLGEAGAQISNFTTSPGVTYKTERDVTISTNSDTALSLTWYPKTQGIIAGVFAVIGIIIFVICPYLKKQSDEEALHAEVF